MSSQTEICVGCSGLVPVLEGPAHAYMTAAPGCWEAFGRLTARLADSPQLAMARQYCVDAYAVQHPGEKNAQAIQSVAIHLMSLYSYLERGRPVSGAPLVLQRAAKSKGVYRWLQPPSFEGGRTVLDMAAFSDDEALTTGAREWARSAWNAWRAFHGQVVQWYLRYGG